MKKLFRFFKPYWKLLIGIFLLLFIQTYGVLYLPTLTSDIINIGVANADPVFIRKTGWRMLVTAVISGFAAVSVTALSSKFAASFGRDLRRAVFVKGQEYSIRDFQIIGASSMITRCTNDIVILQKTTVTFIQMFLPAPVMAIAGFILAFRKDSVMSFVIVAVLIAFGVMAFAIGCSAIPLYQKLQVKMDSMNRVLREFITGMRVIRAFHREEYEKERFDSTCTDYYETSVKVNRVFATLLPTLMMIMNLGIVSIIWFGGIRVANDHMQIGDIMAMIEYLLIILYHFIMGTLMFMDIPRSVSCAERINEVLDLSPEIQDGGKSESLLPNKPSLAFKNVNFRYPGAEEAVLSNISFTVQAGQTTAIIGGTGSGKSTIANLIPRFFEIESGEILVNGIDIRKYTQHTLREKIGFVPQKAFLFRGTINSNILFGKNDAAQEEIEHAAKIAQAHDFILSLEHGYESYVAQGGNNLSGGQKQRISIARALVKKPEIYVFDDSFSALDFKTDANLRRALKSEVKNSAVLIVAQRISTIMNADQIVVLDKGRIVGIGTHRELLKSCEIYHEIAASQLSKAELIG